MVLEDARIDRASMRECAEQQQRAPGTRKVFRTKSPLHRRQMSPGGPYLRVSVEIMNAGGYNCWRKKQMRSRGKKQATLESNGSIVLVVIRLPQERLVRVYSGNAKNP